jgi:transcriptional regulator with XRE-family HTH domain
MRAKSGNKVLHSAQDQPFERAAAEMLRVLRGKRSQRAFARRLGYRANPITDWEHGRRFPTAAETLRAARLVGVDVTHAFSDFHAAAAPRYDAAGRFAVAPWLGAIRGTTPIAHLAARVGCSRFAMARWLHDAAQPRLPDFFRCVEAITGRLPDLVAALVPIDEVPSLAARYRAMRAARRLAFDAPWTEAVLRVIETSDYQALARHDDGFVARRLGIPADVAHAALRDLKAAAVIRLRKGLWRQNRPLSVDTRGAQDDLSVLLDHWSSVGHDRIRKRRASDFFAYDVMSVSRADYDRIGDLLRHTFREIQSIVAASEPSERVALLNLQLLAFD